MRTHYLKVSLIAYYIATLYVVLRVMSTFVALCQCEKFTYGPELLVARRVSVSYFPAFPLLSTRYVDFAAPL